MSSPEPTTLSDFPEEFSIELEDGEYMIRLLHEFGRNPGFLTREKIRDLWIQYSKHEVLFSDHTAGKVEPFLDYLADTGSVWWEIEKEGTPIGLAMLDRVRPGFDAYGHFAVWDSRASDRIPIFRELIALAFERYELERISAEVPAYQAGVLRFVRRLGFFQEGEKRRAVLYKGKWFPFVLFGVLRGEFNEWNAIR